ncbi:CPBP family intramembrane metalloprotease [Clostridioides difficile]|nr:CPBP family intramembrane metalloprotease [Clostridioides difficile]
MKKVKKSILLFLIICFALSSIFYYLIIVHNMLQLNYFLMWCPGVAAIIVSMIYHRGDNGVNFRRCHAKYILGGILIPLAYWGISYSIYLLIYGKGVIVGNMALTLIKAPSMLLTYLAIYFVTAMGEEIGWGGYLVPKLNELFGFNKGAFVSGVIWFLWHFPLFVVGYMSDIPLWYQLPVLALMCISVSYSRFYLSMKSKSTWPAVWLHFVHNFVAQLLLDQSIGGEMRPYLVGEIGIISLIVVVIIALICVLKYRNAGSEIVASQK